jgi:hypothetical protein
VKPACKYTGFIDYIHITLPRNPFLLNGFAIEKERVFFFPVEDHLTEARFSPDERRFIR